MSLRTGLRSLWTALQDFLKHPLWGGLTTAGIVAGLTYLWVQFQPVIDSLWPRFGLYATAIGILLVAVLLLLLLWRYSRPTPKTLVFLSWGGTCRDPMAKAITTKLFEANKPKYPVVIRAAGLGTSRKTAASLAAQVVIKEMYDQDLLADHKPELLTQKLADEADLILAMEDSLLKPNKTVQVEGWPGAYSGKVYLLKEFFGRKGDVADPYPDGLDKVTLSRYRKCADELRQILTQHFDQLVKALQVERRQ